MGLPFFLLPTMPREARPFSKFVEIGRVCFINYGPLYGKLCVVLDVIDNNRAWVDGPGKDNNLILKELLLLSLLLILLVVLNKRTLRKLGQMQTLMTNGHKPHGLNV